LDGTWKITFLQEEGKAEKIQFNSSDTAFDEQFSALRNEMMTKYQYVLDKVDSPEGRLNILCTALVQINTILKSSLGLYATNFAKIALNKSLVIAKATDNYLAVWPCQRIREDQIVFRKTEKCYNLLPIKVRTHEAFMDDNLEIYDTAVEVKCNTTDSRVFEFNDKLFIQRRNSLPTEIRTDSFKTISFMSSFNISGLVDLPGNWSFKPEVFNDDMSLISNIKEDILNTIETSDHIFDQKSDNYLAILALRNLNISGFFDFLITWITRVGGGLSIYMYYDKYLRKRRNREQISNV
jgi:hypothetical protein